MNNHHTLFTYVMWLVGLVVIALAVYAVGYFMTSTKVADLPASYVPRPIAGDEASNKHGFDYFVSFTASGFQPATLTVTNGQTIRFTNNTTQPMQVSIGAVHSPALDAGRYWEYTTSAAGSFTYSSGNFTGTLLVQ